MELSKRIAASSGSILPGVFIGLVVLGLTATMLVESTHELAALLNLTHRIDRAARRAVTAVFEKIPAAPPFPPPGIGRIAAAGESGGMKLVARGEILAPSGGVIDFESLLNNPSKCRRVEPSKPDRTANGELLTPSAARSPMTCRLAPEELSFDTAGMENLSLTGGTAVPTPPSGADTVALSSPGYIEAPLPLVISNDAVIVAGGDIFLAALEAAPLKRAIVTVVSATGRIVIGRAAPTLSLDLHAPQGVSAPLTAVRTASGPKPPRISRILLGIYSGAD